MCKDMDFAKIIISVYYANDENGRYKISIDNCTKRLDMQQLLLMEAVVFERYNFVFSLKNGTVHVEVKKSNEEDYKRLIDKKYPDAKLIDEERCDLLSDADVMQKLEGPLREKLYYEEIVVESINSYFMLYERDTLHYEIVYGFYGGELLIDYFYFLIVNLISNIEDRLFDSEEIENTFSYINYEYAILEKIYNQSDDFLKLMEIVKVIRRNNYKNIDTATIEDMHWDRKMKAMKEANSLLDFLFLGNVNGRKFLCNLFHQIEKIEEAIVANKEKRQRWVWKMDNTYMYEKVRCFHRVDDVLKKLQNSLSSYSVWKMEYMIELSKCIKEHK